MMSGETNLKCGPFHEAASNHSLARYRLRSFRLHFKTGAVTTIRTLDIFITSEVLYLLSYNGIIGSEDKIRTYNDGFGDRSVAVTLPS